MGKNDFLTPKAISNRIKSKGLQKLRWFCQMCQKQCRDENGFKCHLTSESHKRQMEVFGQNAGRVIRGYSEEFEANFLELMRRSHPNTRVEAKRVYNEYIQDKLHVHMNSTKWYTLGDFVKYLGETGKCRIEDTPKGWFISLIKADDFEKIAKERKLKRARAERDEQGRNEAMLREQIERAAKAARTGDGDELQPAADGAGGELQREEGGETLRIELPGVKLAAPALKQERGPSRLAVAAFADERDRDQKPAAAAGNAKPRSAVQSVMEADLLLKKQRADRVERAAGASRGAAAAAVRQAGERPWLHEGIIVKVMSKALKEHGYYKQKGVVLRVVKQWQGEVEVLASGDVLQIDQSELETVLPEAGKPVLVVAGAQQGQRAVMQSVDMAAFKAQVQLSSGPNAGQSVRLDYEAVCKFSRP